MRSRETHHAPRDQSPRYPTPHYGLRRPVPLDTGRRATDAPQAQPPRAACSFTLSHESASLESQPLPFPASTRAGGSGSWAIWPTSSQGQHSPVPTSPGAVAGSGLARGVDAGRRSAWGKTPAGRLPRCRCGRSPIGRRGHPWCRLRSAVNSRGRWVFSHRDDWVRLRGIPTTAPPAGHPARPQGAGDGDAVALPRRRPYLPQGEYACDATALIDLWPHQRRVIEDTSSAFPAGRLLCDEVGWGRPSRRSWSAPPARRGAACGGHSFWCPPGCSAVAGQREKGGLRSLAGKAAFSTTPTVRRKRSRLPTPWRTTPLLLLAASGRAWRATARSFLLRHSGTWSSWMKRTPPGGRLRKKEASIPRISCSSSCVNSSSEAVRGILFVERHADADAAVGTVGPAYGARRRRAVDRGVRRHPRLLWWDRPALAAVR